MPTSYKSFRVDPIEDVYKRLGLTIRKYRMAAGLTQAQMAKRLRMSRGHINYLEHGKFRIYLHHIIAIAKVTGTDPTRIIMDSL